MPLSLLLCRCWARRYPPVCNPEAGATATAETIRSHCRIVMAKFPVSTSVTILDEMPRTVTGKPEKDRLATYSL